MSLSYTKRFPIRLSPDHFSYGFKWGKSIGNEQLAKIKQLDYYLSALA